MTPAWFEPPSLSFARAQSKQVPQATTPSAHKHILTGKLAYFNLLLEQFSYAGGLFQWSQETIYYDLFSLENSKEILQWNINKSL